MKRTTIAAVALAVLVATVGTASALPGNDHDTSVDGERGPPDDLPDPVPDFVTGILDRVGGFVNDVLDGSLGDAVSDVAGDVGVGVTDDGSGG